MATCPRRYVDAPPATPYRHGLFGAAVFPPNVDHFECGVEYQPATCSPAFTTHDPCRDNVPVPDKTAVRGMPLVEADPFTVYAAFVCSLPGMALEDFQRRAEEALALGEQRAVEFAYWTGIEGQRPRLADPSAEVLSTAALSPKAALSALEDYLGREYAGVGVIHGPRGVAPYLHDHLVVEPSGLHTHLGTRAAFGGGYSAANTGPDGAVAAPGTAWLYATGQVAIWRSEVWFNPDPISQAFNKVNNDVELQAERTYVVSHECVLAAVPVDLTCCPC